MAQPRPAQNTPQGDFGVGSVVRFSTEERHGRRNPRTRWNCPPGEMAENHIVEFEVTALRVPPVEGTNRNENFNLTTISLRRRVYDPATGTSALTDEYADIQRASVAHVRYRQAALVDNMLTEDQARILERVQQTADARLPGDRRSAERLLMDDAATRASNRFYARMGTRWYQLAKIFQAHHGGFGGIRFLRRDESSAVMTTAAVAALREDGSLARAAMAAAKRRTRADWTASCRARVLEAFMDQQVRALPANIDRPAPPVNNNNPPPNPAANRAPNPAPGAANANQAANQAAWFFGPRREAAPAAAADDGDPSSGDEDNLISSTDHSGNSSDSSDGEESASRSLSGSDGGGSANTIIECACCQSEIDGISTFKAVMCPRQRKGHAYCTGCFSQMIDRDIDKPIADASKAERAAGQFGVRCEPMGTDQGRMCCRIFLKDARADIPEADFARWCKANTRFHTERNKEVIAAEVVRARTSASERDAASLRSAFGRDAAGRFTFTTPGREVRIVKQCGQCGYGPIMNFDCNNLMSHNGDMMRGGRINNGCPSCAAPPPSGGYVSMPNWDGRAHYREGGAGETAEEMQAAIQASADRISGRKRVRDQQEEIRILEEEAERRETARANLEAELEAARAAASRAEAEREALSARLEEQRGAAEGVEASLTERLNEQQRAASALAASQREAEAQTQAQAEANRLAVQALQQLVRDQAQAQAQAAPPPVQAPVQAPPPPPPPPPPQAPVQPLGPGRVTREAVIYSLINSWGFDADLVNSEMIAGDVITSAISGAGAGRGIEVVCSSVAEILLDMTSE